jgi:hypothetical protein
MMMMMMEVGTSVEQEKNLPIACTAEGKNVELRSSLDDANCNHPMNNR